MKHLTLIGAGLLLMLASCVTSADLRRIEDAQAQYHAEMAQALDDLDTGKLSASEFEARAKELSQALKEEIAATADEVDQRTGDFIEGIPTDPASLVIYLLGMGAAWKKRDVLSNLSRSKTKTKA